MRLKAKSTSPFLALLLVGALSILGCTSTAEPPADDSPATETIAESTPTDSSDPSSTPETDATTSFLAWLEASRAPEVDAACAALAPELVTRMIDEMRSEGFPNVSSCEEMMTLTAELYRAFDQSAEVNIDVVSETATDAELFVTYVASGDCGTVVMERRAAEWIITEQTEECA